jgi:uncharacterized protein YciI
MSNEQKRPFPDETHELLYLVMSRLVGDDPSTLMPKLEEHLAFGADLDNRGITFDGGPLMTRDGQNSGTGMYILRAASLAEAEQIASQDPLHAAGLRVPTVSPWYRKRRPAEQHEGATGGDTVLAIGLHPDAIDFDRNPQIGKDTLLARMDAGEAALREAGFDIVSCRLTSDDPDDAEQKIREAVTAQPVQVAMIGAGLRTVEEYTLLFERIVNLLNELAPGIRFCFNTAPENTIDALRRWARPGRSLAHRS